VFGSGKSHLLVVIVIFLVRLLTKANDSETKILISTRSLFHSLSVSLHMRLWLC
jgi:hypothetical protein